MPYADPERQKAAKRESFRKRYAESVEIQVKEANRKAAWLQTEAGKLSNAEASRLARLRKKGKRKPAVAHPK